MDAMLNEAKGFWEVGLKDLVKELPDFDLVIDELRHIPAAQVMIR